jgi:hypothetical protein
MKPGQPGTKFKVPLQTLQNLKPGQVVPTGQPGEHLVKVGDQYQIVRSQTAPESFQSPELAVSKCKKFLATMWRVSVENPKACNVPSLIQALIDGAIEPEVFMDKIDKELNSTPQPTFVSFLRNCLPYLRRSLLSGELSIDDIRPPSLHSPHQQQQQHQVQVRPLIIQIKKVKYYKIY